MKGPLAWFARNDVAANLLMVLVVAAGILTVPRILVEVFPELSADRVTVTVPYPGAAPAEVEVSICVKVEEELWDLEGVGEIRSTAAEGVGTVTVEVATGSDPRRLLTDVKSRVDSIDTFPVEAEEPIVEELIVRKPVIDVALSGDVDLKTLRRLAERVRDDLLLLPGITQAELSNLPEYEISVEVSERALRRYDLTFDAVADAVRRASVDLPGGSIRAEQGEVLLRTTGQAYRGEEFERLVVRTAPDGSRVTVGDVATVVDGFEDTDRTSRFDGALSAQVRVYRVGDQNALEVAAIVKDYVARTRAELPEGLELATWQDQSAILKGRLDLMLENGRNGLILVFVVLAALLRFRLAVWVSLGIPISFLGALAVLPHFDGSINLISLFAFILVLGIVVDDAIVVGEAIHDQHERGVRGLAGAIAGVREVAKPVTFAVLTTTVAFLPMAFLEGFAGRIWVIIPVVVIATLAFSLLESLFVLPAHLSHEGRWMDALSRRRPFRWYVAVQERLGRGLERLRDRVFEPSLGLALRWRYATLALAVALLTGSVGFVAGGHLRFEYFPPVEGDVVTAQVTMPLGTAVERTAEAVAELEAALPVLREEFETEDEREQGGLFRHWLASIGTQPVRTDQSSNGGRLGSSFSGSHLGEVSVELLSSEERDASAAAITKRWRELAGDVPGALELEFTSDLISAGKPIHVRLEGPDLDALQDLANALKSELAQFDGVYGVADSFRGGKQELELDIRPEAQASGLALADLARQVRQAFYGEEAQRVQRGRDDVKVMVRYPDADRRSLATLDELRVRTPDGAEVPFSTVATATAGRGFSTIQRADRLRTIEVTAEVDETVAAAGPIREALAADVLPRLLESHPRTTWKFAGEQQEQADTLSQLARLYAIALIGIFALMAIPFRSYTQPLIVMSAIPFGLVGAVWGHVLMGHALSIISVLGLVALGGVVVNDSLVLVDYVNRHREDGHGVVAAARRASLDRFRPILLTSLTTFAGLTPLMLERSVQARFLIPMAISLAFGIAFATFLTLVLVPSLYLVLEDLHRLVTGRRSVRRDAAGAVPAADTPASAAPGPA